MLNFSPIKPFPLFSPWSPWFFLLNSRLELSNGSLSIRKDDSITANCYAGSLYTTTLPGNQCTMRNRIKVSLRWAGVTLLIKNCALPLKAHVFCLLSAFVFCSALLFAANKKQTANSDTAALKSISESARTRLEQLRAKAGFPGATLAFVSARTYH